MSSKISIEVISEPLLLGEGPHWVAEQKKLYCVDILGQKLCRIDPATKQTEVIEAGDFCSLIVPIAGTKEDYVVSMRNKITKFNWTTKEFSKLVELTDEDEKNRMNDGKCDNKGRLWFGTMGHESTPGVVIPELGSLYRLDGELNSKKMVNKISLSNGLAWSLDQQKMFFIDSTTRHVYVFDYEQECGDLSNRKVLFDFASDCDSAELPDGMTIDLDGKLWVASYNGGSLKKIDPETGKLLRSVELPATKITSVCFGCDDYGSMLVTSARHGLSEEELKSQPLAGSCFKVNLLDENTKGAEPQKFILT